MAQVNIGIQTGFQPQGTDAAKQALANVGQQATKAEKDLLAYANAQARLARATGDNRGAANIYAQALSQVNRNSKEGVAAQAQLQQAVGRVNKELTGGGSYAKQFGSAVVGNLTSMLGPAAAAATALAAVNKAIEAGSAALALREQQNVLRALAGDTETYNKVVQTAAQQQLLFGGTLQENIAGLQGLVITSRSTGAALDTLISLSQRLAILDPAQGAEGARIALSEVLAGDPRSLARRYEIPLSALEKIKDESRPVAERLAILDQYLNKIGITSEAVAERVDPTAQKFRDLGAAADNAKVMIGGFLADAAAPLADNFTRILGVFQSDQENGFIDFATGILNIQRSMQGLPPLTDEMIAGMKGVVTAEQELAPITAAAAAAMQQKTAAEDNAAAVTTYLAQQTQYAAAAALTHAGALSDERAEAVQTALQTSMLSQATQAAVLASMEDAAAKEEQAAKTGLLQAQTRAAVDAFMALHPNIDAAGVASLSAAGKIDPLLAQLIQAEIRARAATSALADFNFAAGIQAVGAAGIGGGRKPLERRGGGGTNSAADALGGGAGGTLKPILNERNRIADAQFQYELSLAKTNADKIALYERQLGRTNDKAEQLQIRATINGLRNSGGGRGKADPQARGLGALAQDRIDLAGTEQQQLAEVNRQLAAGNLTEHQRNTLLEKRLKLEESIADEIMAQQQANVDAQLKTVQDAQARLKEAREAAGLQRALAGGRLTAEQQQAVGLRLQEIALEQEKRRLDISGAETKAGGLTPINGGPIPQLAGPGALPNPFVAPQAVPGAFAPAVASAPVTVNITLNVDSAGRVSATTGPGVLLNLLGAAHASNAGGGRG